MCYSEFEYTLLLFSRGIRSPLEISWNKHCGKKIINKGKKTKKGIKRNINQKSKHNVDKCVHLDSQKLYI